VIGIVYGWAWVVLGASVLAAVVTVRVVNRRVPEPPPAVLRVASTRVHQVTAVRAPAVTSALRGYEITKGRG
jgi:hypothetical protein